MLTNKFIMDAARKHDSRIVDVSRSQMIEPSIDNIDLNNIDFESEGKVVKVEDNGIDFESDGPIDFSVKETVKPESNIYEGLLKPTAKAMVKVPAAVASSIVLMPGAGIMALTKLLPKISTKSDRTWESGSLDEAMKTFNQIMSIPNEFITTPEEAKAIENISIIMKPIQMAGEGWRLIGQGIESGLKELGIPASYIEPLLGTVGEAAALFAMPEVIKVLKNSNTFRMMTISQRALVTEQLAKYYREGISEVDLLRMMGPESALWREALNKRSVGEDYSKVKNYAEAKSREVKVEKVLENKKEGSVKSPESVKPVDIVPDYTFTSKKGNVYEKIGELWYDSNGKVVDNRFVINAAENSKVGFVDDGTEEANAVIIKGLEDTYKKDLKDITSEEIDKYLGEDKELPPIDIEREFGSPVFAPKPGESSVLDKFIEKEYPIDRSDLKRTEQLTLYHGSRENITSPNDLPTGHRGYFFTESKEVAGKFGDVYQAKLKNKNLFDGRDIDQAKKFAKEYEKKYGQPNVSTRLEQIQSGNHAFYEDPRTQRLLEDLGYDSNWQLENNSNVIRVFDKRSIERLDRLSEPVKEIDTETGSLEVVPQGKDSPMNQILDSQFRQLDPEVTKYNLKTIPEYTKIDNSDALIARIENELNAWIDGEDINIEQTRKLLDQLAESSKLWADGTEAPIGLFDHMTLTELTNISEELESLNQWAQGLDRFEIKRSEQPVKFTKEQRLQKLKEAHRKIYGFETKLTSGFDPIDLFNIIFKRNKVKSLDPVPEPYTGVKKEVREHIFKRSAGLNLANYNTNKFVNSIEQRLTKPQREAMIFVLEKTGIPDEFGRPDLQKVISKDKVHLEDIAGEIKTWFDEGFKNIKRELPNLSVKQIEDYVTHLWEVPKYKKAEAGTWFSTQNRFLERRFIDTYAEGIKLGFKPKTLDILEIIKVHDNVTNRAIENSKYIKQLLNMKRNGISLIQRGDDAPMDWIEVNYPALTRRIPLSKSMVKKKGEFVKEVRVRVHPDLVRPLKAIFEERFDHPVISAYEAINGVMKKSMLSFSLFHHGALGETGIALMGPVKTGNIYFNPVKIFDSLGRGNYDIFKKEAIARDSIEHGVQYGATADIPVNRIQGFLNHLAMNTKDTTMLNRITKFIAKTNEVWDKAIWSYLHDTLKLYGYENLVGKLDPRLNPEMVTKSKREIAQLVNDTFGGQNWDTLMITPKEVQMLTWSLLSADWSFSTTRQALAPTGIGKVYEKTKGLRQELGWKFWAKAGLYFGIGMNLLNIMFRSKDIKDNPQYYEDRDYSILDKSMYGNTLGKKTYLFRGRYQDGTERYIRWGKQFRDFFELLANPVQKVGGKVAPLPQTISEVFTGHSMSGFKNDDIYGKEGLEKTLGIFKTVAKAPMPISLKRFMKENIEVKPLDIIMQSTKGMSRYSSIEYFKKAIIDGDEDLLRDVYRDTLKNNLPAFTLFNLALSWTEAEIMNDISKDLDKIDDVKERMSNAESAFDKRRYGSLMARLQKEKADKEAGFRMMKVAIEKARAYRELNNGYDRDSTPRLPGSRGTRGIKEIIFE